MKSRIEERDNLLTGLGFLAAPIREVVFDDDDLTPRIPYVRSQFIADFKRFSKEISKFCYSGGIHFLTEANAIVSETNRLASFLDAVKQLRKICSDGFKRLRTI